MDCEFGFVERHLTRSNGKTYGKPSANMECPITCCGFAMYCIMARQGGLETIILMEVGFVSGRRATRMCIESRLFRVFWK